MALSKYLREPGGPVRLRMIALTSARTSAGESAASQRSVIAMASGECHFAVTSTTPIAARICS